MSKKIQAVIPFTLRDSDTGALTSIGDGQIVEVSDTLGTQLISDGLAQEFTLITPTGKLEITGTAEVDVTNYAAAQVVDANLVAGNIKKDVTILGVTGTYEA
jgi:hypothetical protein